MRFKLAVSMFFVSAVTTLWASSPCDLPGVVDFYPNGSGPGICQSDPEIHKMTLSGNAHTGVCSPCGPATTVVYQEVGPYGILAPAAVSNAISSLVFTIQFDVYGIAPEGSYLASDLAWSEDASRETVYQLVVGSDGSISWGGLNGQNYHQVTYDQTTITAYDVLISGQCQTVIAVADGLNFYLYVDGSLVGGPLAIIPWVTRLPVSETWFGPHSGGGTSDVLPIYFSNVLVSSSVLVPVHLPERVSCDATYTPTPTPTPAVGECNTSIEMPPDLTFGAAHTVIVTCTPAPSAVCAVGILKPPDLTFGAPHTVWDLPLLVDT